MVSSRATSRLIPIMAESFISSSVPPSDAKSRGVAFVITKTCRVMQVPQTSRVKTHTVKCFGADAVDAMFKKTSSNASDSSIFTSFAQLGQRNSVDLPSCAHH